MQTNTTKIAGKAYLQLESSDIIRTGMGLETRMTGQEMGLQPGRKQQRQQRPHERHDLAHHGTRWLEIDFISRRLEQAARLTTPITTTATTQPTTHEHTTHTTKAHDQDQSGPNVDDALLSLLGRPLTRREGRTRRRLLHCPSTPTFLPRDHFILRLFVGVPILQTNLRRKAWLHRVVLCVVFVLFCFVLFCFVLFCFVLFCFVLFCFVVFCFVLFL